MLKKKKKKAIKIRFSHFLTAIPHICNSQKMYHNQKRNREETDEIILKALKISSQEISNGIGKVHKETIYAIYNNHNNSR
jgi:hypothetical protein